MVLARHPIAHQALGHDFDGADFPQQLAVSMNGLRTSMCSTAAHHLLGGHFFGLSLVVRMTRVRSTSTPMAFDVLGVT